MVTVPSVSSGWRDSAVSLCHRIHNLYERLSAQDDLAPSPAIDALYGDLVHACVHSVDVDCAAVLADPRIREARKGLVRLCADGEFLLERHWARAALLSDDAWEMLSSFPYLDNYQQLTRLEAHALAGAGYRAGPASRVCFVGGGPLPLSAVLLHQRLAVGVSVVDRDVDAVEMSGRLLERLVPDGRVSVVAAEATSVPGISRAVDGCDVVVLAALVGMTRSEKRQALDAVGAVAEPGTYLVVRSAEDLRSLLYPAVDIRDVREAGFLPEMLVHPLGEIVNSVLVARRR
jgi:nicotianamine synthase